MPHIGVIAGTMIDTRMGVELLERHGFCAQGYPISTSCYEQDSLQFLSANELERMVVQRLENMQGLDGCMVYCNSLSAAVDFAGLARDWDFPIITPFDAYSLIAMEYELLYILAANSLATKHIEQHIKCANPAMRFISVGWLGLVETIESSVREVIEQGLIVQDSGLRELCAFFEKIELEVENKALLLGCTHFPSIIHELRTITHLPIIDPAKVMIEIMTKTLK